MKAITAAYKRLERIFLKCERLKVKLCKWESSSAVWRKAPAFSIWTVISHTETKFGQHVTRKLNNDTPTVRVVMNWTDFIYDFSQHIVSLMFVSSWLCFDGRLHSSIIIFIFLTWSYVPCSVSTLCQRFALVWLLLEFWWANISDCICQQSHHNIQ